MYTIKMGEDIIYDPRLEELTVTNPKLQMELNCAGEFSMVIPIKHPCYDRIGRPMAQTVFIYRDDKEIYEGRLIEQEEDFYKNRKLYFEGALSYLNDSIQRPAEYHDKSVRQFLEILIASHNSQVDSSRRYTVGSVTVQDSNDSLYRYTNYENTLKAIKDKLIDSLGGYLIVRKEQGIRYLDYLKELPDTCSQVIRFGENLLDYTSNMDASEIVTRIIPLGKRLEESRFTAIDERLTITSVNNGIDYVQSDSAAETYGIITKAVIWDDVTLPENLKKKGEEYLESEQWENMILEVSAVDLHNLNAEIDGIHLGDRILVSSPPHGLSRYFPVSKMTVNLMDPSNDKITLGTAVDKSISAKSNSTASIADEARNIQVAPMLEQAQKNASSLIKTATTGYIVLNYDEQGNPKELLIMDTKDINTATRVWRWNVNGLGYSSTGYRGEYNLAMTMDGAIVADCISAGTMLASRIKGGTLTLGGINDENGACVIKDAEGEIVATLNNRGIEANGKFSAVSETGQKAVLNTGILQFFRKSGAEVFRIGLSGDDYGMSMLGTYEKGIALAVGGSSKYIMNNGYNPTINEKVRREQHLFFGEVFFQDAVEAWRYILSNGTFIYGNDDSNTLGVSGNLYCTGSISCAGSKNRVVQTSGGTVAMNAFETPEALFADFGSGTIGQDGSVQITFDPEFVETIDRDSGYRVLITATNGGEVRCKEKLRGTMTVVGEPGATFDWMIVGKQKGYADKRMEKVEIDREVS